MSLKRMHVREHRQKMEILKQKIEVLKMKEELYDRQIEIFNRGEKKLFNILRLQADEANYRLGKRITKTIIQNGDMIQNN